MSTAEGLSIPTRRIFDLLRRLYQLPNYERVALPTTALRRFDWVPGAVNHLMVAEYRQRKAVKSENGRLCVEVTL